jgi:hypothetical protein
MFHENLHVNLIFISVKLDSSRFLLLQEGEWIHRMLDLLMTALWNCEEAKNSKYSLSPLQQMDATAFQLNMNKN